jgi:hypothetical protein
MAVREAGHHRSAFVHPVGVVGKNLVKSVIAIFVGGIFAELAEHDAPALLRQTGVEEMREHPVDAVGRFVDILREEDSAAEGWKEGRTDQRGEYREVSADQPSGDSAWFDAADFVAAEIDETLRVGRIGQHSPEMLFGISAGRVQLRGGHRAGEVHEAGFSEHRERECRDVGVADEDFRIGGDEAVVDPVEQARRSGSAAQAEDGADFAVSEHLMKIVKLVTVGMRGIVLGTVQVQRGFNPVAALLEVGDGLLDFFRLGAGRRWRDQADDLSPAERFGDQSFHESKKHQQRLVALLMFRMSLCFRGSGNVLGKQDCLVAAHFEEAVRNLKGVL